MDKISELPNEMLQRILCFLSQEEVVRTSVLSKSWRYIWCTRPNLVFTANYYFKGEKKQDFIPLVDIEEEIPLQDIINNNGGNRSAVVDRLQFEISSIIFVSVSFKWFVLYSSPEKNNSEMVPATK
ncbi:hypothetical protein ABFS82_05G050000 [Erythranthe guttata]